MFLTGIGFIPLIIINIIDLYNNYNEIKLNESKLPKSITFSIHLALQTIRTILYSLEDVCNKISLNKLLIRSYELTFYKALFQIIPIVIISFSSISNEYFSNFISYNNEGSRWLVEFFYRLSFIVFNIIRTISLIMVIEKLNPSHLSILKSLEFIILFIYITIWNLCLHDFSTFNLIKFTPELISCIILFLGAIIHNETIITNKNGFLERQIIIRPKSKDFQILMLISKMKVIKIKKNRIHY